jgi:hypothetical protein
VSARVVCRARVTATCEHGQPGPDLIEVVNDPSFNGYSTVCDACRSAAGGTSEGVLSAARVEQRRLDARARVRERHAFRPGQVLATQRILDAYAAPELHWLLSRHLRCDFGEVSAADQGLSVTALRYGNRILSIYVLHGAKLWCVTEADHSRTVFVFPDEYTTYLQA